MMITNINNFVYNSKYAAAFDAVRKASESTGVSAYLVGGAVRDILLCTFKSIPVDIHDLDFVVIGGNYETFAGAVAKVLRKNTVFFKDNVRIPHKDYYIDISAPRGESIEADLQRRDFTVNNLAIDMDGVLIGDPTDLENNLINPAYQNSFADDPLRILRGFRQAASLNFKLTDEFFRMAEIHAEQINSVAFERINEELSKLSQHYNEEIFFNISQLDIWKTLFDLTPNISNFKILEQCNCDANIKFDTVYAYFLCGLLKETPEKNKEVLLKLHVSNKISDMVSLFLNSKNELSANIDLAKKYIWKNRNHINEILYYATAAGYLDSERNIMYNELVVKFNPQVAELINGNDILQMTNKPSGKWISELLDSVKTSLSFNDINSREDALKYCKERVLDDNGNS